MLSPALDRRSLALAIVLSLLLAGAALGMPPGKGPLSDPDEIGPFAVGRTTFQVTDASRGRTLPIDESSPRREACSRHRVGRRRRTS